MVERVVQVGQQPPQAVKAAGDSLLHGLDTLAAAATSLRDTLSQAPLPGGVASFVRFIFQIPSWIQISAAVVGAIVAFVIVIMLWRRRKVMWNWMRTRRRPIQFALGGASLVVVALLVFGGATSW